MDIVTYSHQEEDLALAQRLATIELARLSGTKDYNIEKSRATLSFGISNPFVF